MGPEARFKKKFLAEIKSIPNSWWTSVNQISLRGTPDILGVVNGRFIALELKKDEKANITRLQKFAIQKINNAHGYASVVFPKNKQEVYEDLCKISAGH